MNPENPPPFNLPDPDQIRRIEAARAAQDATRDAGGDPAALDALAMLRSQTVEGVVLYANPAATYCTLRLLKTFFPEPGEREEVPMDQMACMAYAFAEPVPAYLLARQGFEAYIRAVFAWTAKHFTGGDADYRLGRVVGWCAGILATLEELNPRMPAATLAPAQPASPPAPTPGSSPPSSIGSVPNTASPGNPPSAPTLSPAPSPSGPPPSSAGAETPPAPAPKSKPSSEPCGLVNAEAATTWGAGSVGDERG